MAWKAKQNAANGSGFGWSSTNWSGYAVTGKKNTFHSISGEWMVPKVKPNKKTVYSSAWIGIDGFNNNSLIQTGTGQDYINGSAHYYAWWEILPAGETKIPFPISPGDHMHAKIRKLGKGKWSILLTNHTKHWTFSTVQSYSGPQTSAEWIIEAPSVNSRVTTLVNYGKIAFDQAAVNGKNPKLTRTRGGVMIQRNARVSTPSTPNGDRNGFVVSYGSTIPPRPVSARGKKKRFALNNTKPLLIRSRITPKLSKAQPRSRSI
jgi:hypothetical protein